MYLCVRVRSHPVTTQQRGEIPCIMTDRRSVEFPINVSKDDLDRLRGFLDREWDAYLTDDPAYRLWPSYIEGEIAELDFGARNNFHGLTSTLESRVRSILRQWRWIPLGYDG